MTYAGDLDAVARTLAVVAFHGAAELSELDLDIALVARSSVLELASTVQYAITGHRAYPGVHALDMETRPTAAFAQALAQHPRETGRLGPTDALAAEADTDVGHAWQRIARHAISANHHWTSGTVRLSGPVAWAGLADIATIASVTAELDAELADSAHRHQDRADTAERLTAGTTSGLRTAARAVSALAAAGELPARGPEPRPEGNRGLVTITEPGDIAAAHEQLVNLLSTAVHVRPERMALLVIGHLRTCQALLEAMPEDATSLRTALKGHAEALAEATRHPFLAATIHGGDPKPLQQMQIIRQAVVASSPIMRELVDDPNQVRRLAASLAEVTVAMRATADEHLTSGGWLVIDPRATQLSWVRVNTWHTAPPFLQDLRIAAMQGEQLIATAATVTTPDPSRRSPLPARNLLSPAPFRPLIAHRFAVRPAYPHQPALPAVQHRRR